MSTPQEAFSALRQAGASVADATLLTAIGGAESSWNPNAVGDLSLQNSTWGPSYGVWQIRTLVADTGKGTARDINKLRTGLPAQAAAAVTILHNQGVRAWSTYSSGAYAGYVPQAQAAATRAAGAGATPAGGSTGAQNALSLDPRDWLKGGADLFGNAAGTAAGDVAKGLWNLVGPFWLKEMFAIGGLALIVAGLAVAAKPVVQPVIEEVQAAGEKAADVAKVAAVAAA